MLKFITKTMCATLVAVLCSWSVNAQIKIHDDNHISLMSLTKGGGVQIQPSGYTYFTANIYDDWAWMNRTHAKKDKSKCWIVYNESIDMETFCVLGGGTGYYKMFVEFAHNPSSTKGGFENASEIISRLNGHYFNTGDESLNYDSLYKELSVNEYISKEAIKDLIADYNKKEIGLMVSDIEPVLPDAIRTYSDGRKAINYNAILVVLIEAVKEQQKEIDYLKKTIEKPKSSDPVELDGSENINYNSTKSAESSIQSVENRKSALYQNAPNPFSTSTKIEYEINEEITTNAVINIYNLQGTQLKSYPVSPGKSSIQISAYEYSAGMYFYSLIVNNQEIDTKKMILTK